MTNLGVYCLYDKASVQYGLPFFCANHSVAQRQSCMTLASLPLQFWTDFVLVHVADYDSQIASFIPFDQPVEVLSGSELVEVFEKLYKENK